MPGFDADIRPLFREFDIDEMRFMFDLGKYEDVKANGESIYATLADGSMPCDEPWTADKVAIFREWLDAGSPP
jgi:hypothetical protein